jgi:hypothetical protein
LRLVVKYESQLRPEDLLRLETRRGEGRNQRTLDISILDPHRALLQIAWFTRRFSFSAVCYWEINYSELMIHLKTNLNIILNPVNMPHIDPNVCVQTHSFRTVIKPAEPGKTMVTDLAVRKVILDTIRHEHEEKAWSAMYRSG